MKNSGNFGAATARIALLAATAALMAGCARQPLMVAEGVPGFVSGFFHGLLIVFSMVGALVSNYSIYEFPNTGFFYDFGFTLGVVVLAHSYAVVRGAFAGRGDTARRALQRDP